MLDHVALHAGERVLDVACGTGIVTRVAVQRFGNIGSIMGLDLNPAMLEVARAKTPPTDVPVAWRQGDMCALPLPDASFDVVLCQHGVQFVPDKLAALRDIRRVLVPGGRLAFTVWGAANRQHAALADALTRHVSDEAAASCLAPFAWRDAETIRALADDAGFRAIAMTMLEGTTRMPSSADAVGEFVAFIAARSPFAREIQEALQVLGLEVHAALQQYREGNEFVMPTQTHLVQARVA
jgi:ubiquinone/menaquinone biosynthesis C-methylase UbiE